MKKRDVDIVIALLENQEDQLNISQLSKKLNIDYKNTYNIVKRLEKENIITLKRFGNAFDCILNKKIIPLIFEAEYSRREELLKNKNFRVLFNKLNSINIPFVALIFGSHAKKRATQYSDIDIMLIYNKNENKNINIERTISLLPLDIHPVTFSYSEFLKMARSKEFTVVEEAIKNNIIFIGIEDYYRLIENVKS
ncbi:MAG: nucleotidyltransferase domain-containing protein [Methanobacterium sp.]|nr:nucleotidyltransferase domain-containing protein [Methanobacterium sp.]